MSFRTDDLLQLTEDGLHCAAGGFHIDPWRPVDRAVVTHAHSDHATPGSRSYLCAREGEGPLRLRIGDSATIESASYGSTLRIGDVEVSLHPAGHILGSAQIRLRHAQGGPTWVVSGDYKTHHDSVATPFEPIPCDVFISECTFGLPIFRWRAETEVADAINNWWRSNQEIERTSLLLTYALGKAQRVLSLLNPSIGPIGAHGAPFRMNEAHRDWGVKLPACVHANAETASSLKGAGVIIAPPSVMNGSWIRRFTGAAGVSTAFVSGWMAIRGRRRWRAVDRGFVLSDHADWTGLQSAIRETGAERIGLTHGYTDAMSRWLSEQGLDTFTIPTRFTGETDDDAASSEPGA